MLDKAQLLELLKEADKKWFHKYGYKPFDYEAHSKFIAQYLAKNYNRATDLPVAPPPGKRST